MKGTVCVNKPFGATSFDVVARLRRILKIKKIGHSGTLDPIATGVLPVFVGKATKAISFLPRTDKAYVAGFKLGQTTDTFDFTGKLICEKKSEISLPSLKSALEQFRGCVLQVPPRFSAIKIKGTPAYKLARSGKEFELQPREVSVFKIECLNFDFETQAGSFFVHCSSGTYIRSICRDLGAFLGVGCVLTSLVRTMACGWNLSDCFTLEEIEKLAEKGETSKFLCALGAIFKEFDRVQLDDCEKARFLNGARVKAVGGFKAGPQRLVSVYFKNEFLGLARVEQNELAVEKLFV